MHLKYDFETMRLDDWIVAVPVGDSASLFQGVVKLSETAKAIFDILENDTSFDAIVDELAKQYDVPRDVLVADVTRFVNDFTEKGLLENENNH